MNQKNALCRLQIANLIYVLGTKEKTFSEEFQKNPMWVFGLFLSISFVVSFFAAVYFRPEYLDGSIFIFDALNSATPPRMYLNHRWISNYIYGFFKIFSYFDANDSTYRLQRFLASFWIAMVPIFTFALGVFALIKQKREYLLPYAYFVFGFFLYHASLFHESLVPETLSLGLLFVWLYPQDSKNMDFRTYTILLLISSIFVLGYEPFVLLFIFGFGRLLWALCKKSLDLRDHYVWVYFVACLNGCYQLWVRFSGLDRLHPGQSMTDPILNEPTIALGLTIVCIGMGVFLLAALRPLKKGMWLLFAVSSLVFLGLFLFYYNSNTIDNFNINSRFIKIYLFCAFSFLFCLIAKERLLANQSALLKWSLFCCCLFWLGDLKGTYNYAISVHRTLEHLKNLPVGCHIIESKSLINSVGLLLKQNSFRPEKVEMGCIDFADILKLNTWDYCNPVSSFKGKSTIAYLNTIGIAPERFNFDKILNHK